MYIIYIHTNTCMKSADTTIQNKTLLEKAGPDGAAQCPFVEVNERAD